MAALAGAVNMKSFLPITSQDVISEDDVVRAHWSGPNAGNYLAIVLAVRLTAGASQSSRTFDVLFEDGCISRGLGVADISRYSHGDKHVSFV